MDEKEKDLLPENEQEKEETSAEANEQEAEISGLPADELSKELDELKDLFQQVLDEKSQESEEEEDGDDSDKEQSGELIQELSEFQDDSEAEETDETEIRICECCEEKPCSTKYGEDYPYCDDCREFMKKHPMRASGFITAFIMTVVFFVTAFTSISAFDESLFNEYLHRSSGNLMSAIESGVAYLNTVDSKNVSENAVRGLIEDYRRAGFMAEAVNVIERYYTDTELKMPWNWKYKRLIEETEMHTNTYYAVAEVVSPVFSGQDYDYDDIMAKLGELKDATDEDGKKLYGDMFIDFFSVEVMNKNGVSLDEQLALLRTIEKENKDYEWVYLPMICSIAARAGDTELIESSYKKMKKNNAQDMNCYIYYASYFRYLETPDADKMIEICNEAARHAYNGDISYKPTLAVAYLLKGEGSLAMQEMDAYMQMGNYNVSQCNLYALTALYNGNEDIYESIKALLEGYGYEMNELVEKYKNGKMEIAEVLKDKGGNIG